MAKRKVVKKETIIDDVKIVVSRQSELAIELRDIESRLNSKPNDTIRRDLLRSQFLLQSELKNLL